MGFQARLLDDNSELLTKHYRLRYQVYCLERKFLPAEDYPNGLEVDEFDDGSLHVGVIDSAGELAGTARVIRAGRLGLPLFRHCTLFPQETTLSDPDNMVVEVSRVAVSRHYSRRRTDPTFQADGSTTGAAPAGGRVGPVGPEKRQHSTEPFITLVKAIITGVKSIGATHFIGATDAALHRWLRHYGFPYRLAGPEVDYYGDVAPHIMSMAELDQVILGGQFPVLNDFPVGPDAGQWLAANPHEETHMQPAREA